MDGASGGDGTAVIAASGGSHDRGGDSGGDGGDGGANHRDMAGRCCVGMLWGGG